ncbi:hypothetical protein PTKIN_Ptkin16aG0500400 [Pterospermum kingtungense]
MVEFNVDGGSLGKPGSAGIRGILRDHQGTDLIRFSKEVGIIESNMAELLAIREAFILFLSSPWLNRCTLIVESDSRNAVNWVLKPESAPWRWRNIINHVESLKAQVKDWRVVHVDRGFVPEC